jgi:tRNA(adenine34) deaminase
VIDQFDDLMGVALDEARTAIAHDDVPVGAVIVRTTDGVVLAQRHNERELAGDPTAHAELLAIADAAREREGWRLDDCALVVTLEPCPMCAGAALAARIPLVVFGAADPKAGALGSLYHLGADPRLHHGIDVHDGVRADEAGALLKEFFARRRLQ